MDGCQIATWLHDWPTRALHKQIFNESSRTLSHESYSGVALVSTKDVFLIAIGKVYELLGNIFNSFHD